MSEPLLFLDDGALRVGVTTHVGPRILAFGRSGKNENILAPHSPVQTQTELGMWRAIGGHRLWISPEQTLSYRPDDTPVTITRGGDHEVLLTQPDPIIDRSMRLHLTTAGLQIDHTLLNRSQISHTVAAWALTILAPGGTVSVPQERYALQSEDYSPARPMVLWRYSDVMDPRVRITRNTVEITPDAATAAPNKLGFGNTLGFVRYTLGELVFTKRFDYDAAATYPDFGCTTEVYVAGSFIELETLGPLRTLAPGEHVCHTERWQLTSL